EFTRFAEVASRSGRRGGTSFITGFAEQAARTQRVVQRSVERPLQEAQKVAAASGGRAGSSFVSGFTRPVQTMTLKVSQALDPRSPGSRRWRAGRVGVAARVLSRGSLSRRRAHSVLCSAAWNGHFRRRRRSRRPPVGGLGRRLCPGLPARCRR